MAKKIWGGLVLFFLFLVSANFNFSLAETSPFKVDYNNVYTIFPSGRAKVEHHIKLTNKVSSIYVTDYTFTIFHPDINGIKVFDSQGELDFNLQKEKKKVRIKVHFPKPVIGLGKSHNFTITYIDNDVSQRTGRVWELNIPIVDKMSQVENYHVKVNVPSSFPPLLNSYPRGKDLSWDKNNLLGQKGIKIIFGDYQSAVLSLEYHLKNDQEVEKRVSLALPPDTDYQKVSYRSIDPLPQNVEVDTDGNWLAIYTLKPHQKKIVKVKGKVWIFLKPRFSVSSYLPLDKKMETAPTDVWPVNSPEVVKIASSLKTVRQAYKYTLTKLDYSYKRAMSGPDRMGALGALKNPDLAVCMEYTDLFITFCRYLGVPAREINGYAYANNSLLKPLSLSNDVLHAWPEFYDTSLGSWHQVDPTWEDTTGGLDYFYNFDLNHITFVIHGVNPYYPLPAGAYKDKGDKTKEVVVKFVKDKLEIDKPTPIFKIQQELSLNLADTFLHTGRIPLIVTVENPGREALYLNNLRFSLLSSSLFSLLDQQPQKMIIPPFGHRQITYWLSYHPKLRFNKIVSLFKNKERINYQIQFDQQKVSGQVVIRFNLQSLYQLAGLSGVLLLVLIILGYSFWRR